MRAFLTLAASRPVVAWSLGYAPFLVVITGVVAFQSGWRAAGIAAVVNAALMAQPVAAVWVVTWWLARSGMTRSWWSERALGVTGGILATAVVGALAVRAFIGDDPAFRVSGADGAPQPAWMAALTSAAIIAAVNVVPLALGVAIEGAARTLSAPRRAA